MKGTRVRRRYRFPNGHEYPVLESREGIYIRVLATDLRKAKKKDPGGCAIAVAARRACGSPDAFIAGTVAYIVMPIDGVKVAVRFSVPVSTREAIKKFDRTGKMPAEGFRLKPLEKSRRAVNKKKANDRRPAGQRRWKPSAARKARRDSLRTYRYMTGHVRVAK